MYPRTWTISFTPLWLLRSMSEEIQYYTQFCSVHLFKTAVVTYVWVILVYLILSSACPAGCQSCTTDDTTVTCTIGGCVANSFTQGPTKTCVGKCTRSLGCLSSRLGYVCVSIWWNLRINISTVLVVRHAVCNTFTLCYDNGQLKIIWQ